jgi:beta-lactamase regulating signal transducer with metallopeptidase domain
MVKISTEVANMSLLWLLGIVCGVLLTVFVVLVIYRSTLTMREDDQLFLDESASQMAQDQMELMAKVNKVTPMIRWLGAASGVLILVIAGLLVYQGLNPPQ